MRTRTTIAAAAVAAIASLGVAGTATAGHDENPSGAVGTYAYTLAPVQAATVDNSQGQGRRGSRRCPTARSRCRCVPRVWRRTFPTRCTCTASTVRRTRGVPGLPPAVATGS
jgi:hypothetical protein